MFCQNIKKINIFICLSLGLAACATTAIESNKDTNYTANIHRMSVTENIGHDKFADKFNSYFLQMLKDCGVTATRPGEKPDATLVIGLTSIMKDGYGIPHRSDYELTLRDNNQKIVWKSVVYYFLHPLEGELFQDKSQKLAMDIINRMNEDGLLKSCTVTEK